MTPKEVCVSTVLIASSCWFSGISPLARSEIGGSIPVRPESTRLNAGSCPQLLDWVPAVPGPALPRVHPSVKIRNKRVPKCGQPTVPVLDPRIQSDRAESDRCVCVHAILLYSSPLQCLASDRMGHWKGRKGTPPPVSKIRPTEAPPSGVGWSVPRVSFPGSCFLLPCRI